MVKINPKIKNFLWPSPEAPLSLRLLPYLGLIIIGLAITAGVIGGWTYTNSDSFCGTTCHTMPPQYTTHAISPHARVQCVECHLGRDNLLVQIPRKLSHSKTGIALIFNTYEYPIIAREMRPAIDACETCHYPQKFSDDSLREIKFRLNNEFNTPKSIFLTIKTGGGSEREGLSLGIHWHVENKVTFYATDDLQQDIPYIRVEDAAGKVTEYYDLESGLTSSSIPQEKLQSMDCITCHNRDTHYIPNPAEAVDNAINTGGISAKLPYVRDQAVSLLSAKYPDQKTAFEIIAGLPRYYEINYPNIATDQAKDIQQAVKTLQTIYQNTNFPEQKLDYTSHPNNIGHQNSAGCFRCHDGKHFASKGESIRLECNLCHNIPTIADPKEFVVDLKIVRGPEPASHSHTSWILLHNKNIDATCAACHPPKDPATDYTKLTGKPVSDGSFCGNAVCHTYEYPYMHFDSPAVKSILETQMASFQTATPIPSLTPTQSLPDTTTTLDTTPVAETPLPTNTPAPSTVEKVTYQGALKAIFDKRCSSCHTGSTAMANMDLSTYQGILNGNAEGKGIVPGKPEDSLVFKIQNAGNHFGQMSSDEVALLKQWILDNAPEK
jgi:hypothetical protein